MSVCLRWAQLMVLCACCCSFDSVALFMQLKIQKVPKTLRGEGLLLNISGA